MGLEGKVDFTGQLAALNRAVALERLGGDEDLLREIAGLFLEDTQHLLSEIRQAVAAGDAGGLQRAAHTLKGSVGNFGAERVFQAAYRLEMAGRSGNLAGAPEALCKLESELGILMPELAAIVAESS
jgi:two-component system, sensor histidine kinase and response regulator